ncbi:MAG: ABC transporter ATP-binding protein [Chloroflexi bacterium]|nr:ABC transporter ATP-binding protein [Chloroflexota bacterium]
MHTIELVHVTKRFGKVVAVDDLSLTIERGNFLTLLGPSGCGKTTVLRMLAGLEEPDAGDILIDGKPVFSAQEGIFVPPAKRNLGLVFQSYALWPHMTVYQNVAFGLEMAKQPKQEIQQRIGGILKDLQIGEMGQRYPQEMSGGQQQRVALARMLAPKPGIFLLDEPLSNLDARLRVDMRSELKRLHRDTGATTLYVTHDQLEALTMSTHIVVMKEGRVQQHASPAQVYRTPANLFVADFIGSPKINLLDATATLGEGGTHLKFATFEIARVLTRASGAVVAGIRPEDIRISPEPDPNGIEFKVYSVLPAGSEIVINAHRGATSVVIRETRDIQLEMDSVIWLQFDSKKINLYDKQTGSLIAAAKN